MSLKALGGLKVVEWSEFVSGPYCGKLLADLGAEVIKVEKPGCGDKARSHGPFPQDIPHLEKSGLFLYLNTNKLGVTLNVRNATGAEIFRELVKWADVLVENHPSAEVEELGFQWDSLKSLNPRLVMTSITSFGQTGPYRDYKACDLNTFHASGLAFENPSDCVDDTEQQPPLKGPLHQSSFVSGLTAAVATMSAVFASQMTGQGQQVDLSEHEALASIMRRDFAVHTMEGMTWTRLKGSMPGLATSDIYRCSDGLIYMSCGHDRMWAGWMEAMGNPEWAQTELFQDRVTRRENWDAVKALIEEWTMERTRDELAAAADIRRVPCRPLNTVDDLFQSELLAARDYFQEVDHQEAGKVTFPGAPYKFSKTPWHIERPAPLLGEHNEEVFCGRLGYTKQDLVRIRAEGAI